MATVDQYRIRVNVQGEEELKDLRQAAKDAGQELNELANRAGAAAGAALTALVGTGAAMAKQMRDVARATGNTTGEVYAFSQALVAAGGEMDDVESIFSDFNERIDDAANGSEELRAQFERLGISLDDIANKTDQELFEEAIRGLGDLEAGSERTSVALKLFGGVFETIDAGKLADELERNGEALEANGPLLEKTAMAVDNLRVIFEQLKIAALQLFEPIIAQVAQLQITTEQAQAIVKALGITLATAFGVKVVAGIVGVVTAIGRIITVLRSAAIAASVFLAATGPVGWAALAAGAAAATAAVVGINQALGDLDDGMEDFKQSGTNATQDVIDGLNDVETAAESARNAITIPFRPGQGPSTPSSGGGRTLAEDRGDAEARVTQELIRQNEEYNKQKQAQLQIIGLESDLSNNIQANLDAQVERNQQIRDLEAKIAEERGKGTLTNENVIAQLEAQKQEVNAQYQAIVDNNNAEYAKLQILKEQNNARQIGLMTTQEEINQAQQLKEFELQRQVINGQLTGEQAERRLAVIQSETELLQNLASLEAQLAQARSEGDAAEIARIQQLIAIENQRHQNRVSNIETENQLEDDQRNSSIAGATAALERIRESVTPFQVAQDQVTTLFSSMERGLDEFAKTGKLNFKDFALSLIRDLLLIQVKAEATNLLLGALGGGGGGGGLLSLFGLASGGPAKANQPYIVGEEGPELFVPKAAGTVIPNDTTMGLMGGSGGGKSVINNNTYVTNTVQAVDAKSVAALFAENRKTLFGAVTMAQKEQTR